MSFGRILFEAMAANGDRPAVVSDREQLTHAQVLSQARHLAANLAAAGIRPGQRVGIAVQDVLESALCIFACWQLAATPAVIDFRAPRAQRARLARDFGLTAVLESRSPPGEEAYPSLRFERDWRFAPASAAAIEGPVDCSNPAFLMFSSGTTGDPKAYIQTHEALLARTADRLKGLPAGRVPRFLSAMTLTFSASRHHVLTCLAAGGTVRFFPPLFTTSELIEGMLAFEASASALPPPVIARMVHEAGERPQVLFPGLVSLDSIGGPALPQDKIAAWRNLSRGYCIRYASSLTGAISALAGEDIIAKPESAGRLLNSVRVEILDGEGRALPNGESGVIKAWTRSMASAVLAPGGEPFVDPKTMGPDWGIPGDIGFIDDDGFLTIVDRMEDMIVRGGVNVAPQELEKLIRTHPKVADVAVLGFPDAVMGQEIAAFVVSEAGMTIAELRSFLNASVSSDRRPRELRLVTSLPYNDNGKLLRRVLVDTLAREKAPAS